MCGEVSARVRRLQPPELECEEKRPRRPEFDVPLAHEVLEASLGVSQHVLEITVVRVVDSAAAAEHDLGPQPDVELAPATLGAHRDARPAESGCVADGPSPAPEVGARSAAWTARRSVDPASAVTRNCGSQSHRFPAPAKSGNPTDAKERGLRSATRGDS